MPLLINTLDSVFTVCIRTLDRELKYKPSDWNVWLQSSDDTHIAKRTASCVLDTMFTEQVVTAWRLYCIMVNIEANGANPSVVGKALC